MIPHRNHTAALSVAAQAPGKPQARKTILPPSLLSCMPHGSAVAPTEHVVAQQVAQGPLSPSESRPQAGSANHALPLHQ